MGKRKHRSKSEWQELIEQQASSDLNAVAFCQAKGLSSKTFYRKRKRLAGQSTDLASSPFIAVQKKTLNDSLNLLTSSSVIGRLDCS